MIRHALRTGKDKRTDQYLSVADLTKIVEVAAKISMPAQSQITGLDSAPFIVRVLAATEGEQLKEEAR